VPDSSFTVYSAHITSKFETQLEKTDKTPFVDPGSAQYTEQRSPYHHQHIHKHVWQGR